MSAPTRIVVGLGNPEERYSATRHNVGWMVADALASKAGAATWKPEKRHEALMTRVDSTLFVKPLTYMNRSGQSVGSVLAYFKLEPSALLVIGDDLDLPFGTVRFRSSGSSGGQKGLASILEAVGTEAVERLRVGIGRSENVPAEAYVLSPFSEEECTELPGIILSAVNVATEALDRTDEPK